MSGVILRCPNCGTTQPAEGQCDACHEAAVSYFCTNHTPGAWLNSAACPQCGARFGDPAPARQEPVSNDPPELRPAAVRPPPHAPVEHDSGPWDSRAPSEPGDTAYGSVRSDPLRILLGAVAAAARARAARAEHSPDELERTRPRGSGCVGRIIMLALLLLAFILMAPLFLSALLGF